MEEVVEGLKTALELDWKKIEQEADRLWSQWDHNFDGEISQDEFTAQHSRLASYMTLHYPRNQKPPPPSIEADALGWFTYWDENGSGNLCRVELVRALVKTLRLGKNNTSSVAETVDAIWPIFDTDGSGAICGVEFAARDGLAETLIATLRQQSSSS
jgi:Ca2+-binding EF-hand superfamily protein